MAALVFAPNTANAISAIAPSKAGSMEVWGTLAAHSSTPDRASYSLEDGPWATVALGPSDTRLAITGGHDLKRLSSNTTLFPIPTDLESVKVKAAALTSYSAVVVTDNGSVETFPGRGTPAQSYDPTTLTSKAVDIAGGTGMGAILLESSRVGMLSSFGYEVVKDAEGRPLTGAAQVGAIADVGMARLTGGGVVGFTTAGIISGYPAAVSGDNLTDPVATFDVAGAGAVAVTQAGNVYTWNSVNGAPVSAQPFPASALTGKVIDVAANNYYFAARTDLNEVVVWGLNSSSDGYAETTTVPAAVNGHRISDLVGGPGTTFAAIMAAPLQDLAVTDKPTIGGTLKVGSTLTVTPAAFSGGVDSITNKWFADGTAIEGATDITYKLTAAELGKNITAESTATREEDGATLPSLSDPKGPVAVEDTVAANSTTVVSAPSKAYGTAGTATVTVSNGTSAPITGTVTLTGAGAAQTKALVGGKASFTLAKNLAPKTYMLSAKYSGNSGVKPSTGPGKYTVAKGKAGAPTYKTNKAPTSKKSGKATVTVKASSDLAKASGKVTVTIKGKSSKKITATLSGGKKTITLPKLKKGSYKVTVAYAGDGNYGSAKSKTYSLKIKK